MKVNVCHGWIFEVLILISFDFSFCSFFNRLSKQKYELFWYALSIDNSFSSMDFCDHLSLLLLFQICYWPLCTWDSHTHHKYFVFWGWCRGLVERVSSYNNYKFQASNSEARWWANVPWNLMWIVNYGLQSYLIACSFCMILDTTCSLEI